MESDPIMAKYDLCRLAPCFPPRPLLLRVGYDDKRVGTEPCRKLAECLDKAYAAAGAPERVRLQILAVKGHVASEQTAVPCSIADWLREQGFLWEGRSAASMGADRPGPSRRHACACSQRCHIM